MMIVCHDVDKYSDEDDQNNHDDNDDIPRYLVHGDSGLILL